MPSIVCFGILAGGAGSAGAGAVEGRGAAPITASCRKAGGPPSSRVAPRRTAGAGAGAGGEAGACVGAGAGAWAGALPAEGSVRAPGGGWVAPHWPQNLPPSITG